MIEIDVRVRVNGQSIGGAACHLDETDPRVVWMRTLEDMMRNHLFPVVLQAAHSSSPQPTRVHTGIVRPDQYAEYVVDDQAATQPTPTPCWHCGYTDGHAPSCKAVPRT